MTAHTNQSINRRKSYNQTRTTNGKVQFAIFAIAFTGCALVVFDYIGGILFHTLFG